MVNCPSASRSSVSEASCRYCSTQVRNGAATRKHSDRQRVCLLCTRLYPQSRDLRFSSRKGLPSRNLCLKSAPCPERPPTDSFSNITRDFGERDNRASTEVMSTDQDVELTIAQCGPSTGRPKQVESEQTSATYRPLRANATESQAIRGHYATRPLAAVDLSDSPRITAEMTVCSATSTEPKDTKLCVPSQSKLDTSDKSKEPRCSRSDPRHQSRAKECTLTMRKHRAHSASLIPIQVEHIAGTDTNFSSGELKLQRDHQNLYTTSTVVSRGRSQSAGKPVKSSVATIDMYLSTTDRRPRQGQHARTNAGTRKVKTLWHGKHNVEEEQRESQFLNPKVPFQRKTNAQLIDFYLSTFDLKPPTHTAKTTRSEHTTPTYSKDEPCDLAYLDEFKSYTL